LDAESTQVSEPLVHTEPQKSNKTSKNKAPNATFQRAKTIGVLTFLVLQVTFSIVQLSLAATWKFWFGVGISIFVAFLGVFGILLMCHVKFTRMTGKLNTFGRITFWILDSFFTAWIFLLLLVHLVGKDPSQSSFPAGCRKKTNCTRLTTDISTNVRGEGLICPQANTTLKTANGAAKDWINSKSRSDMLTDKPTFLHARFVSSFWGFPDDFYVELVCQENGAVAFWVQSEARLGTGDFGVNEQNVKEFTEYINRPITFKYDFKCTLQ